MNLQRIGLALLNYEQANHCFPPAIFTDDHGKPMMSWRVAILPYLEHSDLYRAYDATQSWNSPKNRVPGSVHLEVFRCPSDPGATEGPAETNYVRIVGKDTVGGMPNEAVKISDITDGTSNTIMVVEVCGLHIHWAEPRDVTVEEFTEMVAKGHASFHSGGFQALFVDGSVHFISYGVAPKTLRALLLRNDGQPVGNY
jgi:prepilin-type processing-associated H-X9-DG protein